MSWFDQFTSNDGFEVDNLLVNELTPNGDWKLALDQGLEQLEQAIDNLPDKQQQVFLLR